jgi:hypothetical protein
MTETVKHYYDVSHDESAPQPGQYLVSIGKRGIGIVELIKSVSKVNHRVVTDYQRYNLEAIRVPELKPYVVYEMTDCSADVWVRGVPAWPMFWHPRGKK